MNLKIVRAPAIALGLVLASAPAFACDKQAAGERIAKVVATGDVTRPTRISEGFAVEVNEKFWSRADDKLKQQIVDDVACTVGTDTVSFTRDRGVLQTYRNGKPQ